MLDDPSLWILIVIIILALGFGVVNGFNDAANAIATVIPAPFPQGRLS